MRSSVVAVVPARLGSQRLPGKNRRQLAGQSLFDRAIECALTAVTVHEVIGSTDDPALLARPPQDRVTMLPRAAHLATDRSSTLEVILDVFERVGVPDVLVLLQPTSPLRVPDDVDACVSLLLASPQCPSVVTTCTTEHPIEWTFENRHGVIEPVFGWDALTGRSQDQPLRHRLNGAVYAVRGEHLVAGGTFVSPGTQLIEMPHSRSVDIDTEADFVLAATLLKRNPDRALEAR